MRPNQSVLNRLFGTRQELMRGDSAFALLIFVVVGVFLVNVGVSVWDNVAFHRNLREKASVENIRFTGGMLAKTAESLMAVNEMSLVRRTVAEAGLEHGLESCRIVLPDGTVVADADPRRITAIELPASWSGSASRFAETQAEGCITLSLPLVVMGRGSATLEMTARLEKQAGSGLEPQTAQMAIACLALATMLLVHRHARFRLKAIGAIHEALLAVQNGHSDVSALQLDPSLGREAVAWNRLLAERQGAQIRSALEQVKQSVHHRPGASGELVAACEALPQGLILLDEHMHTEYANGAAAVLLQTPTDQLIGSDLSPFIKDPSVLQALRHASRQPASGRIVVETKPDAISQYGVLRFTVRPIHGEGQAVAVVIIEDITQQKVAAAARDSFLAQAAHELRTPLTSVQLYVEQAIDDCQRDVALVAKSLNVVNEESRRLERTVAEILSVSEIEAGSFRLHRDDVHLDSLLEHLKADFEPQAKDKHIEMTFDLPPKLPVLHADRDKISLALHNLVGNAIKYGLKEGRIAVRVTLEEGFLRFAVSDTGIGIAPEDQERIFEKFYRSKDKRIADITGSGLGLAIARDVVRLHGGDITVESVLNQGSTFTLTLPLPEEANEGEHSDTTMRCSQPPQA